MTKTFVWLGLLVGSTLGGMVPLLWGGDMISIEGILLTTLGGVLGIAAGYRLGRSFE